MRGEEKRKREGERTTQWDERVRKGERRRGRRAAVARRSQSSDSRGRTKRPKEPVLPKPRGENTITPLPKHNEFIAGNLRTINAELLMYCFASSRVASENGHRSQLFSVTFLPPPSRPHSLLDRTASLSIVREVPDRKGGRRSRGRTVWSFTVAGASYYDADSARARAPFARAELRGMRARDLPGVCFLRFLFTSCSL